VCGSKYASNSRTGHCAYAGKFLLEGGETMKRKLLTKVGMERCVTLIVVELQTRGDKTWTTYQPNM
jgi:hypothetical protein